MNTIPTQLENLKETSKTHINQLVELIISTGYYQYAAMGNKLGIYYKDEVRESSVIPYLPYTKVILDDHNNIAGCYIALSKGQYSTIPCDSNWRENDAAINKFLRGLTDFYDNQPDDCYLLIGFAVRFDLQGMNFEASGKRISDSLIEQLLLDAKEKYANRLAIAVWESHIAAVKFYQRHGAVALGQINLSLTIFKDNLLFMEIPVAKKNIFR